MKKNPCSLTKEDLLSPGATTPEIRVLVVDDHDVVRFGIVGLLNSEPNIVVVGEAQSSEESCVKIRSLKPDVVLLDLEMDDATGAESVIRLREIDPDVPIVIFTAYDNDWRVTDVIRNGIQGYLIKDAPIDHITQAIEVVANGGAFLDPIITMKVMGHVGRKEDRRNPGGRTLSEREHEVLKLLAKGKRNKEIASVLYISERTVKFHISAMLGKLRASNRTDAVRIALAEGIIPT